MSALAERLAAARETAQQAATAAATTGDEELDAAVAELETRAGHVISQATSLLAELAPATDLEDRLAAAERRTAPTELEPAGEQPTRAERVQHLAAQLGELEDALRIAAESVREL